MPGRPVSVLRASTLAAVEWPPDPGTEVMPVDDTTRLVDEQLTMMIALRCSGETV